MLVEKEANYFLDKHSHDFKVDLIIITGTFEIELSNSNIILFPGSRFPELLDNLKLILEVLETMSKLKYFENISFKFKASRENW